MSLKGVQQEDLEDALDHASDFSDGPLSFADFQATRPSLMPIRKLYHYDDVSAWAEWSAGELRDLDEEERFDELVHFRGERWAKMAERWKKPADMSPIVIIETASMSFIGDGRGRVSYAIGMGWREVPAVVLSERN